MSTSRRWYADGIRTSRSLAPVRCSARQLSKSLFERLGVSSLLVSDRKHVTATKRDSAVALVAAVMVAALFAIIAPAEVFGSPLPQFLQTQVDRLLEYRLEPGSTITPVMGGTPIGPTEKLTGYMSFVFRGVEPCCLSPDKLFFEAEALDLESRSFSILFRPGFLSGFVTNINNSDLIFGMSVEGVGVGLTPFMLLQNFPGLGPPSRYEGPSTEPSRLILPDLRLLPEEGGLFRAYLDLSAQLITEPIPEPSSLFLLIAALFSVWVLIKFKGHHFNPHSPDETAILSALDAIFR